MNCQAAFPKATPRTDAEDAQPSCAMGNVTESKNGSGAVRSPMNARTGLVPDWLERQHAVTRPDRVMTITEYDERITAALGVLSGTLYLVCRRLLLDSVSAPMEGVADTLAVTSRELADRLGLQNHTQIFHLLNEHAWFMQQEEAASPIRAANGAVTGRTPHRYRVYGLPPLLPVDQVAVHRYLQARVHPGQSHEAVEAVDSLIALSGKGWDALRAQVFAAQPSVAPGKAPFMRQPLSILALAQQAGEISAARTPMALVQSTNVLRTALRGNRIEVPLYLIDHWLPELGVTRFWILLQVLRECQMQERDNAVLRMPDVAARIGISERTCRRLVSDLDGFAESFSAFTGTLVVRGGQLEFRRVLYTPESVPLAPVHDFDWLASHGQNPTSALSRNGQNPTSGLRQNGQKATSQLPQNGQKATSVTPNGGKMQHRGIPEGIGPNSRPEDLPAPFSGKMQLEEKSLNIDSLKSIELTWEQCWPSMQSHGKLKRSRKVREQAGRHLTLWVAAVIEQMTRGMEDPITLAVDGFNPETSQHTVPYSCLEPAHRGPAFTTQVLAAMAWPDLDWPSDPDRDRCIQGLRRIGMRAFKESAPQFATHTLSQLGLMKLAEGACAELPRREEKESDEAPNPPTNDGAMIEQPTAQEAIWQQVLRHLQMELPAVTFDTWMVNTELVAVTDQAYTIATPTQYAADWLKRRMSGAVRRILSQVCGVKDCTVEFLVQSPN